jgi:hypothetical protein
VIVVKITLRLLTPALVTILLFGFVGIRLYSPAALLAWWTGNRQCQGLKHKTGHG